MPTIAPSSNTRESDKKNTFVSDDHPIPLRKNDSPASSAVDDGLSHRESEEITHSTRDEIFAELERHYDEYSTELTDLISTIRLASR